MERAHRIVANKLYALLLFLLLLQKKNTLLSL